MLKGPKADDQSISTHCLETRGIPAVFLRLQSARDQVALPYSSLIKIELKNDATAVELSFVTHRVTITGKNLSAIYRAVAEAEARLIAVLAANSTEEIRGGSSSLLVNEIRVTTLEFAGRLN